MNYCHVKITLSQRVGGARACDQKVASRGEPENFLLQKEHRSNIPRDRLWPLKVGCLLYAFGKQQSIPMINRGKKLMLR